MNQFSQVYQELVSKNLQFVKHVWATLKQKHETRLEMSIFLYDATHNKSLSFKKNTELHITPC